MHIDNESCDHTSWDSALQLTLLFIFHGTHSLTTHSRFPRWLHSESIAPTRTHILLRGLLRSNRADIRHHPKVSRLVPQTHHLFALRLSALRCVTIPSFYSFLPDRSSIPGNACSTAFAHTPVWGGTSTDPVPRAHQRSGRTHGFTESQNLNVVQD